MYTAIILDDEEKGRNSLRKFVSEYCKQIEIVGVASTGEAAIDLVFEHRPQILFFDIEIAQGASKYTTSFDLFPDLPDYNFEVVFVTAYEHYALKAIQSHAVGYVLKPISISDLVNAMNATIDRLKQSSISDRLGGLMDQLKNDRKSPERIWVNSHKDIIPIEVAKIVRLEAQGTYTDIICSDGKLVTSSKNIGEILEMLDDRVFIKIHRSHAVNIDGIARYSKTDGGTLVMADGKELTVSRSGKERLFELLSI